MRHAITGVPQAIASTTGKPKPSARLGTTRAVAAATPSVVNIYTTKHVNVPLVPLPNDPELERLFRDIPGFSRRRQSTNLGSGVIVRDDGYNPTNTSQVTNELVLQDEIFAMVGGLGTPTHSAVVDFLNSEGVPDLFVSSGSLLWDQPKENPTTFGWQPDYEIEGKIIAQYVAQNFPNARVGLFLQDDDFGRDGEAWRRLVRVLSHEINKEPRGYAVPPLPPIRQLPRFGRAIPVARSLITVWSRRQTATPRCVFPTGAFCGQGIRRSSHSSPAIWNLIAASRKHLKRHRRFWPRIPTLFLSLWAAMA